MSKRVTIEAKIQEGEMAKREKERREAAERARRKAEIEKEKCRAAKNQFLNDLQDQTKEIANQQKRLNTILCSSKSLEGDINYKLNKVKGSQVELNNIEDAIESGNQQLQRLKKFEEKLNSDIKNLIKDTAQTKEDAKISQSNWMKELNNLKDNSEYLSNVQKTGDDVFGNLKKAVCNSKEIVNNIEKQEAIITQKFNDISKIETEYNKAITQLSFIDNNKSFGLSAFTTLQSLTRNNYRLSDVVNDGDLKAWFEKVDEDGKRKKVFVKISKAYHESDEWLEELTVFDGFKSDECIDENDNIIEELENLGVRYKISSSKYPFTHKQIEKVWINPTSMINNQRKQTN